MIGLFEHFFTITINHSALAILHNSLRTCSILVLVLSTTTSFWIRFSYNHSAQTQRKTQSVLLMKLAYRAVATTQLRRRVHTSLPYACWVSAQSHLSNNNRPTWHHTFWSFSTGERSPYNDRPGLCSPQGQRTFLFSTALKPVPGSTQPPIQRVPGTSSPGVKRRGLNLVTHLHLMPRSKMGEL
jgi:hypothetical protein